MNDIIFWIIFGGIAGAIAKFIMPGSNEPQGCIITIILGIIGAIVGGFIGRALGLTSGVDGFNIGSFAVAVVGAILVLFIYSRMSTRR